MGDRVEAMAESLEPHGLGVWEDTQDALQSLRKIAEAGKPATVLRPSGRPLRSVVRWRIPTVRSCACVEAPAFVRYMGGATRVRSRVPGAES